MLNAYIFTCNTYFTFIDNFTCISSITIISYKSITLICIRDTLTLRLIFTVDIPRKACKINKLKNGFRKCKYMKFNSGGIK